MELWDWDGNSQSSEFCCIPRCLIFALRALDVSRTDFFAFTGALCIDDWAEFGGT